MIAQGTLLTVAARNDSPSSWRTRPRLGRPDSTSTLARWVRRSWVWRISVMSEPTPRKPSKRPAGSTIGSPGHGDPPRSALGLQFHLERVERLLLDQHPAELGMAAEKRRQRMADQLGARAAEQHAHARADVAHAILIIDLPQPADAALLIFEQQLAGAFALRADIGVGLELLEGPAGHRQNAENRHAEREHQRQHVLEGDGVARDEQSADDAGGEDHHPGGDAGGNDDQPERRDPKARHQRSREQLRSGAKGREQVKRKRQPDERSNRDFADQQPLRDCPSRPADAGDRLRAGELHRAKVERRDHDRPAEQQAAWAQRR